MVISRPAIPEQPPSEQPLSQQPAETRKRKLRLDQDTRALVGRLVREYVRPHKWRIVAALACMVVAAGSLAAFTQLIKPIVNEIFVARRESLLLPIAAASFGLFLAKGFSTYGQAVLMSFVGGRIVADIQTRLFERLLGADLAFFHEISPGKLVARFINDVNLLRNSVTGSLTGIGKDALAVAALTGVMFYEDWLLASVAFFAFPTAVLPIARIGKRMRKVSTNTQEQVGELTTLLDEVFQGVRHVKAYAMESYETGRAQVAIDRLFQLMLKATRTRNLLHPIMESLGGAAIVAVMIYGGHQVVAGAKDPGAFFAFIFALMLAYEPVKKLAGLNANLQEGLAAAQRVFELIDRKHEIQDRPSAAELLVSGATIRFEQVTFSYSSRSPALRRVDLVVPGGKTVALVGPSGAGKSTVLNLIPRFYDVDSGQVTIDDQAVEACKLASLRAQIGLVSQEIILFDDTVGANIAYGRPGAAPREIEEAARHAGAHDFISELPQGYDTRVGPRGVKLSGGQRQRIAIARAMLKNAPILLLDEATSALDTESERIVQRALKELMTGRTTVVIAHRLSTVADADLIYVMEDGQIVESGTHRELLDRAGAYSRLYALQFTEDEPLGPEPLRAGITA